jgi:DNA end-binding protein Ku
MKAIWSGAISFGLVYIPVHLFNATVTQDLDLDMLRKSDLCPIHYAKVCRETGDEVPNDQIVKGYEYRKGEYVVVTDEDLKRANVKKTQTIEIVAFIEAKEVDQKYLEKPYYLEPVKQAAKAYALLREAMRRTDKVGVARFVLRTREHMALLKPEGDVLVLNQMRFASEIKPADGLNLPKKEKPAERELEMAVKLIGQLSEPWKPEQYHDTYIEELKRFIEQKAEGKEPAVHGEEPIPIEVTDLFAKLRESLDQAKANK